MKRHSIFTLSMLGLAAPSLVMLTLVGCGSGKGTPTAGGEEKAAATTAQASATTPADDENTLTITEESTPDIVVSGFLEALRSGDKESTSALLTAKALAETTKHGVTVDPMSSPDSMYEVAAPKFLADNPKGAHVDSIWHEKLADGSDASYTITWVLRKEVAGWRIAGLAMEILPGEEPRFLNFEDPIDMLKKRDEAIAAAQSAMVETAQAEMNKGGAAATTASNTAIEGEEAPEGSEAAPSEGEAESSLESSNSAEVAPAAPARPNTNKLRAR